MDWLWALTGSWSRWLGSCKLLMGPWESLVQKPQRQAARHETGPESTDFEDGGAGNGACASARVVAGGIGRESSPWAAARSLPGSTPCILQQRLPRLWHLQRGASVRPQQRISGPPRASAPRHPQCPWPR